MAIHDLNNILYPIIINTEMLLEETDPGTSAHEALGQTLKAAHRQKDLVKKILSFSRQSEQRLKSSSSRLFWKRRSRSSGRLCPPPSRCGSASAPPKMRSWAIPRSSSR